MQIQQIIDKLGLQPHPEGGYYKETYRSEGKIDKQSLGNDFKGDRNYCTSIYFLLTSNNFSAFHRIKQDEIWNFYSGSALYVHVINRQGEYTRHQVGMNLDASEVPQLVVPANCWFASSVKDLDSYSLVGCTVAPGFDFEDFELATRADLIKQYPQLKIIITDLTRS